MEDKLQKEAIEYGNGSALILAGPGSGKTHVLTHHIKYLIENGVSPESVIVITFTKFASNEMTRRFKELMPEYSSRVTFGTFHSVFFRLCKEFYSQKEFPSIISEKNRFNILLKLTGNQELAEYYLIQISKYKAKSEDILFKMNDNEKDYFFKVYEAYNLELSKKQLCDYDDLILNFFDSLNDLEFINSIRKTYKYILIDEFQDINKIQYDCVKKMFPEGCVFAVGDEDQSIYGFRGASKSIMKDYVNDYKGLRIIELVSNYRSKEGILLPSINLVSKNPGRLRVSRQECIDKTEDNCFYLSFAENETDKIKLINRDIKNCLDSDLNCAVLLRTNKEISFISTALKESVALSPNMVNREIIGTIADIIDYSLYRSDYFYQKASSHFFYNSNRYNIKNQIETISNLKPASFASFLRYVCNYEANIIERYNYLDKNDISLFFDQILNISRQASDLKELLDLLKAIIPPREERTDFSRLEFMTFHKSKGLEFDCVFIPNLNEGMVPGSIAKFECNIEEERRLLYVAMTRARKKLFLYSIKNEEGSLPPSRFIKEMF